MKKIILLTVGFLVASCATVELPKTEADQSQSGEIIRVNYNASIYNFFPARSDSIAFYFADSYFPPEDKQANIEFVGYKFKNCKTPAVIISDMKRENLRPAKIREALAYEMHSQKEYMIYALGSIKKIEGINSFPYLNKFDGIRELSLLPADRELCMCPTCYFPAVIE